jgi:D-amino-acid oxidase
MDARAMSAGASNASQLAGYRVVVVGAGAIGLSTATELRLAGADVKVLTSPSHPMVSPMACALFLPTWIGSGRVLVWSDWLERAVVDSWHRYRSLLNEFGASAGIRSVMNHEYLEVGDPDPPGWLQSLLAPSTIGRRSVHLAGRYYDRVWKFGTIAIDMSRYLPWLRRTVLSLGISIEERHLQSLGDAGDHETRVVVNCSGLGARTLVPDEKVRPVRGQVLFLEPKNGHPLTNFVGIGIGEYCLIPRITDVGLGSLFEREADWDAILPKYSRHDEKKLLAALDTLLDLSGANRSDLEFSGRTSVGLRPIREGGCRLEASWLGDRLVVQNYGHGGAGVTLAWGCGNQVVDLMRNEFNSAAAEINPTGLPNATASMGTPMTTAGGLGSS